MKVMAPIFGHLNMLERQLNISTRKVKRVRTGTSTTDETLKKKGHVATGRKVSVAKETEDETGTGPECETSISEGREPTNRTFDTE